MLLQTQTSVTKGKTNRQQQQKKTPEEKAKLQETNTQAHETAIENHLLQGLLALNSVVDL